MKYFQLLNKIKDLDTFGATYKTRISSQESEQKSLVSGTFSILLYALSLAYFSLIMYQWCNGDKLPKISSNQNISESSSYLTENAIFQFAFMKAYSDFYIQIDNVLSSILQNYAVSRYIREIICNSASDFNSSYQFIPLNRIYNKFRQSRKFVIQYNITNGFKYNSTLQQLQGQIRQVNEFIMAFVECDRDRLLSHQNCANQSLITKFWGQGVNLLQYTVFTYQYNTSDNRVDMVKRNQFINLNLDYSFFGQYSYMTQTIIKDDGLLFKSYTQITILNQFELLSQTTTTDQLKDVNVTTYLTLSQRLSPISFDYHIMYPKLDEVLASVIQLQLSYY